ncbi:MAG: hypothetical protein R3350_09360 [Saprospiraceae bacterium]|nr:hypothetical protein [Saprospiraceae bacterium]
MKKSLFVLLGFLLMAASAQAQTVSEILENYFENSGGKEKWESLESTRMKGKMAMQGMEFPGMVIAVPPNKQRVEVNVQGMEIVQAYDGETAWWINPMQGPDPQKMPAVMAEAMTQQEFESPFINYEEKGHQLELLGTKEVEGAETYELKLTKADGQVQYYYFDSEYYVPIMVKTAITTGPAKGQEAETFLSDYQEIDGLMMPYFIETKVGGQTIQKMTIDTIVLNETFEEAFFAFPKKEAEEKNEGGN